MNDVRLQRQADGRLFAAAAAELLRAGRAVRFVARGRSMRPFVREGDLLTVVPVRPAALRLGDLAFYETAGGALRVHRVLRICRSTTRRLFFTRGDALTGPLERVSETRVLGKVIRLRRQTRVLAPGTVFRRQRGVVWAHCQTVRGTLGIQAGRLRRWLRRAGG